MLVIPENKIIQKNLENSESLRIKKKKKKEIPKLRNFPSYMFNRSENSTPFGTQSCMYKFVDF